MLPDITLDGPVADAYESQCTYRCVVLPDYVGMIAGELRRNGLSMRLQVRGAP
mgnify:CR=1 FL=1